MPTRTILLVEDDPNDEHLTLRALRQSGVPNTVVVAHSAHEALDFLERTGRFDGRTSADPRVIFVDNALPGFAGADFVSAIRGMPEFAHIPVVVFSGSADLNLIERCSRAGANSFLEKPLEMAEYARQISTAARYWLNLNLSPKVMHGRATAL